jgi:hypothetical protein
MVPDSGKTQVCEPAVVEHSDGDESASSSHKLDVGWG